MGTNGKTCAIIFAALFGIAGQRSLADVTSTTITSPPTINGIVADGEWNGAGTMSLTHGVLMVQNDDSFLYLLIDLTSDTNDDAPADPGQPYDYFNLSFDVNRDGVITDGVDVNYTLATRTQNLSRAFYQAPNTWQPGGSPPASQLGVGFGPTLNGATPHRFWELGIALSEINGIGAAEFFAGLGLISAIPGFYEEVPAGFTADFSDLWRIAVNRDCNGDGTPDADELAADPGLDADGDGVLDACEGSGPTPPTGGATPACAPIGLALPMMMLGAVGLGRRSGRRRSRR